MKLRFKNPRISSRIPPLPYEIFSIIAEFLAGAHAFGTLANLNVANHMMRMETMPILYETVLLDNIEKLEYYKDWTFTLPLGFKYTKYVWSLINGKRPLTILVRRQIPLLRRDGRRVPQCRECEIPGHHVPQTRHDRLCQPRH
jgi:hypothetical protein